MADVDYDDMGPYSAPRRDARASGPASAERTMRVVNGAGAAVSLALVLGLGVWGYKLAVRDVNGIPVIRALSGPARIAPENPGGELADHQGLAVNAIAAEGEAAAPAERLTLAPRPAELDPEDQAMAALWAEATPAAIGDPGMTPLLAAPEGALDAVLAEAVQVIPADVPGPSRSLRPLPRPGSTALAADGSDPIAEAAAAAVAAALAPEPPSETELAADSLPAGTRLAQLGAFRTEDEARAEWDKVAGDLAPLMQGKKRVIETAESGGRTFYRLRVQGFDDLAAARRFCEALKAEGRLCTPAQAQG